MAGGVGLSPLLALRQRIELGYLASGNGLGWRFLYSPERTLNSAKVCFVGLNPGGSASDSQNDGFCTENGSAYELESWAGYPPGSSPLQIQVRALFAHLGVPAQDVLAGNLIPFRSRSVEQLVKKEDALRFGIEIWREILLHRRPEIIITMSADVTHAVTAALDVKNIKSARVGWGNVSACAGRTEFGICVGLPHLSRFGIITRTQSQSALNELFGVHWNRI